MTFRMTLLKVSYFKLIPTNFQRVIVNTLFVMNFTRNLEFNFKIIYLNIGNSDGRLNRRNLIKS